MAIATVATKRDLDETDPGSYGAAPIHGNFTHDAGLHLWCAKALSVLVSSPQQPLEELNDDIQDAIRFLLECEINRAYKAESASHERK